MRESREILPRNISEQNELEKPFDSNSIDTLGRYPAYRGTGTDGFQLMDYWRAIRKRLWLVIGIAVLFTTLTAIYMVRKPNIYSAKATIQVDLEQNNPDVETSEKQRAFTNADPSYFNTQLQLLAGETLLRRVIKEHSLDTNTEFQKAKNQGGSSALRSMLRSVGLVSEEKPKTETTDSELGSNLVSADDMADAIRLEPFVRVIKRDLAVEPVRDSRMTSRDTRLIEVSYRHTSPELAAFVVNAIGDTFTNQNQEKRTGSSRKTSDFLQKRIIELQSDITRDEQELVRMKQEEGIINTEGEMTIVLDRLAGLNKSLLEAENARKIAEAEYMALKDSPERQKMLSGEAVQRYTTEIRNSTIQLRNKAQEDIAKLNAMRAKLLYELKETAPEVVELDRQIKSLNDSVERAVAKNEEDLRKFESSSTAMFVENLRTKYLQAKNREDSIRASFNEQYNKAQVQNSGAVKLRLLEQNIATNKGFLENLQKQQSSNDVASQGTDNNIRVEGFAIPPETPVSPSRMTTVLAALFLSTLFGMGLALFMEYLDDTIKSTEEIENLLQLPALAAIPSLDSAPRRKLLLVGGNGGESEEALVRQNSGLLIHADPRSSLSEAYRQLRTSILLSTAGHAPKTLLITSSMPSEGKTTTATNTAISLAQTGAKVLIIDGDMRRPRLHTLFNVSNARGLSTLLSSELTEENIFDAIDVEETSKLNLLTSGPVPPNPAELIGSEQMSNLLKELQNHFTHIVVDSPPIASFTDGVLIASMVDGVILVVHAGKISRQVVKRSKQLLQDIGAKIFGIVLNNVNLRSQDNAYYYQSYYHRESYHAPDEEE